MINSEIVIPASFNGEEFNCICYSCSSGRRPEHQKTKCLYVNKNTGLFNCKNCGDSGIINSKKTNRQVSDKVYKKPTLGNITELSPKVVKYFMERGVSQQTLIKAKVSEGEEYMPQLSKKVDTIQFIYFRDGEPVNIKYRTKKKHFKLFSGAELLFYNLDSILNQKEIYVTEGEIDTLSFIEAGINNVVSVPNGANLKTNNLQYLDNCWQYFENVEKVYISTDNDPAGNVLCKELARRIGVEKCYRITFGDFKDANECLVASGIEGIKDAVKSAQEFPLEGIFTAKDIESDIEDYYVNGLPKGVGIGIEEFDELLTFMPGYMTVITGVPSSGKSEILDQIICSLAIKHNWKGGLYSPENHPLQLHFSKIAEKIIGKGFSAWNKMDREELKLAKEYFNKHFFFIKPEKDFTIDSILASVKQLILKFGISYFVIDAWNKIDHKFTGVNELQYISQVLDKLTMFCEMNSVHLFLVAHPTKMMKDKRTGEIEIPNLYSVSGSAHFYNKTANGICVHRDFNKNSTKIFVQKVKFKHWGKIGQVDLKWDYQTGRYTPELKEFDKSNWLLSDEEPAIKFNSNFLTTNIGKPDMDDTEQPF